MRSSPAAYLRCNTLIIVAGWKDLVRTRLSVTTIPSGCDRSIMSSSSIALTLRVEQGFSQCVLTFKYIHLGHCLLPVLAFIHICSGVALDEMPLVYSAHPYGRPTVLSSYTNFYNNDAGAPNNGTACLYDQWTLLDLYRFARYGNLHWQRRSERVVRTSLIIVRCNAF